MKIEVDNYQTGYVGLSIELSELDLKHLILSLQRLQSNELGHVHLRSTFAQDCRDGEIQIGDVEISLNPKPESLTHEVDGSQAIDPR